MDDRVLMDTVREYRCLYDKGVKDFKDKRVKANAWKEIATKLEVEVKDIMDRYSSIRTVFGRYLKKLKPPSGSGRDSVEIKPEFEYLKWLICHIEHGKTISNTQQPAESSLSSRATSSTTHTTNDVHSSEEAVDREDDTDVVVLDEGNDDEQLDDTVTNKSITESDGKKKLKYYYYYL